MPLSAEQRAHLTRRLEEEHARTLRDVRRGLDDFADGDEQDRSGDLTKVPFHPADLGTDANDAEVAASNMTRQSRELAEIEDALDRIRRTPERFGVCDETGREIPFERLDVIPWARTCSQAGD